jgi:hypothetical protein
MKRTVVLAAVFAVCAVLALLALWGYLWALLLWSPLGLAVFTAAFLCALGGAGAAVRCALEDRRART